MATKIIKVNRATLCPADLAEAACLLRIGRLVAFPTETVYGLGANAMDPTAASRIYEAKGRPSDNPLIVHIADFSSLKEIALEVPKQAISLIEAFWPGPLTIILKKNPQIPRETTGGLDTVAVRMPSDPIANLLIRESKLYIAAPSANTSGRPSTTRAEHVIEDMNGRIDMIIDGGPVPIGLESTIVDLSADQPLILRPGSITKAQLEKVLPNILFDRAVLGRIPDDSVKPRAPGMKYRHYAPKGELTIFEGSNNAVIAAILQEALKAEAQGKKVGILATEETAGFYNTGMVRSVGSRNDERKIASTLFELLREFDRLDADFIFSECFEDNPLGQAVMNRLLKAAGYRLVKVS